MLLYHTLWKLLIYGLNYICKDWRNGYPGRDEHLQVEQGTLWTNSFSVRIAYISHLQECLANKSLNSGNSGLKLSGNSSNSSNASNTQKPNLEGKLGQDGKLTPEEHQWCFDNNLCLFCGTAGHKANEWWKWAAHPKGNSMQVTSDGDDSAPKNV